MTALTVTQLADIRQITGADSTVDFSDAQIQAQYDLAAVDAPDSDLIFPYTYVYILRRLWGIQRVRADRTVEYGDRVTRSQITDVTKQLLDYWEGQAGLEGQGRLSSGVISLGMDEDEVTA